MQYGLCQLLIIFLPKRRPRLVHERFGSIIDVGTARRSY
jgi:hypothetical protein